MRGTQEGTAAASPALGGGGPASAPRRKRRYDRSNFYVKAPLRLLGPRKLDGRTHVARQVAAFRAELVRDLGGEESLSAMETTLVDVAARMKAKLEGIDAWLIGQPSLVDKRHRRLLPVVREAQALTDALIRVLDLLGLPKRGRPRSRYDDART